MIHLTNETKTYQRQQKVIVAIHRNTYEENPEPKQSNMISSAYQLVLLVISLISIVSAASENPALRMIPPSTRIVLRGGAAAESNKQASVTTRLLEESSSDDDDAESTSSSSSSEEEDTIATTIQAAAIPSPAASLPEVPPSDAGQTLAPVEAKEEVLVAEETDYEAAETTTLIQEEAVVESPPSEEAEVQDKVNVLAFIGQNVYITVGVVVGLLVAGIVLVKKKIRETEQHVLHEVLNANDQDPELQSQGSLPSKERRKYRTLLSKKAVGDHTSSILGRNQKSRSQEPPPLNIWSMNKD